MKTLIVTGGTGGLGSTVVARLSRDYTVTSSSSERQCPGDILRDTD
jgi:nucleoside-diphosphate-sugar epimerase